MIPQGLDEIILAPAIARTLSDKEPDVPVNQILLGTPSEQVVSRRALADLKALDVLDNIVLARQTETRERQV